MKTTEIIIVDDHEIVRDGISSIFLTVENIHVMGEAGDSDSLFKLLSQKNPDIILLDITLPGKSGIEIAKIIKVDSPEIKVLMLSADGCKKNIFDALEANVDGFILKNSGKETLLQAIRAINRGERFYGHSITQTVINEFFQKKNDAPTSGGELSEREREILKLLTEGLSHKQIASTLFLSKRTIDTHINNIMLKLDIHSKVGLVRYAIRNEIARS